MNIVIANKIYVYGADHAFKRFLESNYVIDNPEYIKRVRLNKWIGNTPKKLHLYEDCGGGDFVIPYGCLQAIYIYLLHCTDMRTVSIESRLNRDANADWEGNDFILRDYQRQAVNAMIIYRFGVLKAPCSSGKTVMGHLLAKATGKRTLWLTHTTALLEQSKKIGQIILGVEDGRVGVVTDGKVNWGDTITYATVQTMVKVDPKEYAKRFDCVIVDEVHRATTKKAPSQMSFVINNIAAEYKFGLSATPETLDGYGRTVFCNIGDVKYEISKDILEETKTIMPVDIIPIETGWKYPRDCIRANGTVDFNEAVKFLHCNRDRNKEIVALIHDRPTLILSNSIDHLCYIINELSDEQVKKACLVSTKHDDTILQKNIDCKVSAKAREEYFEMLRNGEKDIMFSTYQLAKEGLNIPRLEQVIMAFPAVNDNIITQSVGRVARASEGKTRGICYDLIDKPTYFKKKWAARKRLYKKNGNLIVEEKDEGADCL